MNSAGSNPDNGGTNQGKPVPMIIPEKTKLTKIIESIRDR